MNSAGSQHSCEVVVWQVSSVGQSASSVHPWQALVGLFGSGVAVQRTSSGSLAQRGDGVEKRGKLGLRRTIGFEVGALQHVGYVVPLLGA